MNTKAIMSTRTDIVRMPHWDGTTISGMHACLSGYDNYDKTGEKRGENIERQVIRSVSRCTGTESGHQ